MRKWQYLCDTTAGTLEEIVDWKNMQSTMKWVMEIDFTLNLFENHKKFLFTGVTFHVLLSARKDLLSSIILSGDFISL